MEYFWTEEERKARRTTECIEFQRGEYIDECWKSDSLCIHGDIFYDTGLYAVLKAAVPSFDRYGVTEVDKKCWKRIKALAEREGGAAEAAVAEMSDWVEENFKTEEIFTVLGI
ncbi:MAG: hypothetical protein NC203_11695 [Firmicutes bacterium]|nr:hypothetical protein [[Eubacterium] siraeum]MCM1489016.1 hypothetical protein [Bacillota bacterium]